MIIYKITNKINNKIYIGRTRAKNPFRRWNEHKSLAKNNPKTPITYAIRKYGYKNFSFEIIEDNVDIINCADKESFYIKKYNCLCPNGYNVEMYQPYFFRTEESKLKNSLASQHIKRNFNKKYIGVFLDKKNNRFHTEISFQRRKITKSFNSETKAAIFYDKLALFLFGNNALINFDCKRNKWFTKNNFFSKTYKSLYCFTPKNERNIYFDKKREQWRVRARKDKKTIYVGGFSSKKAAIAAKEKVLNNEK